MSGTTGTMRRCVAGLLLVLLGPASLVHARDHLVDARASAVRLSERAASRARDLVTLRSLLESDEAAQAAATVGVRHPARYAAALHQLGDADLRDLARRAERLRQDPTAGGKKAVVIVVVVVVVLLVVAVVEASSLKLDNMNIGGW